MTEDDARSWVRSLWGPTSLARLERFAAMVEAENAQQNLVSAASIPTMWTRHIVDSAQLIGLVEPTSGKWFDIGTGGGFPGLVIAILRDDPIVLVEPRRRRAAFLSDAVASLELTNAEVRCERAERLVGEAAVVSARAVKAPKLFFSLVRSVTMPDTRFVLPGGRDAERALQEVRQYWRGVFHVEHSITDPTSGIIVAQNVRPR